MPVYYETTLYETMKEAMEVQKFLNDRNFRLCLDDPNNISWCYSWSFGRNSFTKFVKLIVYLNTTIYFNYSLACVSTKKPQNN